MGRPATSFGSPICLQSFVAFWFWLSTQFLGFIWCTFWVAGLFFDFNLLRFLPRQHCLLISRVFLVCSIPQCFTHLRVLSIQILLSLRAYSHHFQHLLLPFRVTSTAFVYEACPTLTMRPIYSTSSNSCPFTRCSPTNLTTLAFHASPNNLYSICTIVWPEICLPHNLHLHALFCRSAPPFFITAFTALQLMQYSLLLLYCIAKISRTVSGRMTLLGFLYLPTPSILSIPELTCCASSPVFNLPRPRSLYSFCPCP